jgi:hypothetical protein
MASGSPYSRLCGLRFPATQRTRSSIIDYGIQTVSTHQSLGWGRLIEGFFCRPIGLCCFPVPAKPVTEAAKLAHSMAFAALDLSKQDRIEAERGQRLERSRLSQERPSLGRAEVRGDRAAPHCLWPLRGSGRGPRLALLAGAAAHKLSHPSSYRRRHASVPRNQARRSSGGRTEPDRSPLSSISTASVLPKAWRDLLST